MGGVEREIQIERRGQKERKERWEKGGRGCLFRRMGRVREMKKEAQERLV